MTRTSIGEYAAALRGRYVKASKKEKKRILDEFCQVIGYHRKSAIRLLSHPPEAVSKRRGRRKKYGPDLVPALKVAWEATDRLCSKRLADFLPALVPVLEHHQELQLSEALRAQLLTVSASTIDRLLASLRQRMGRRSPSATRSVSALKALIPIRTCAERKTSEVGQVEVDLAAHCGTSSEGFYLNTLVAVDLATGWVECVPVWGKGQSRVGSAVHRMRGQLPFPLLGLHTDNGGEFINRVLWRYCQQHGLQFTRSRSYKKNDQAHVEQKNWFVVRRFVGYDRYASKAAHRQLDYLYQLVRLYVNFFQPISKLVSSQREGGKVHKQYDRAQTPYQRLLAADALEETQRQGLAALYDYLNPVKLRQQIDEALRELWQLAQPDARAKAEATALARMEASQQQPPEACPGYQSHYRLGNSFI